MSDRKVLRRLLYRSIAIVILFQVMALTLCPTTTVFGSETRTTGLFPIFDSFVYVDSPRSNFGKELYLRAEYVSQKTIVGATQFTVGVSSPYEIRVTIPNNGRISGTFVVTEGGNRDIDFRIKSSSGYTYFERYRVTSLEFSFVASFSGDFYLSFDNSFSWLTSKKVSLSDVVLAMEPFGSVCSPIFLKFSLSGIPPEATINSARLSMVYKNAGVNRYNIVNAFHCTNNYWNEQTITFENTPPLTAAYMIYSCSLNMSGISVGALCDWDVKADVVRSLPSGNLTMVIAIVGGELQGGMVEFFSRESENKPKLEISYTYVSVTSSLSSSIMVEGQNVAVKVNSDPDQTAGKVKIQYSTDKVKWVDVEQFSGGSANYAWTPPATGQIYVRGVWEISWNGGSYNTLSSVNTIYVVPIYLLVVVPVAIIVTITGIYFWRKKKLRGRAPKPS